MFRFSHGHPFFQLNLSNYHFENLLMIITNFSFGDMCRYRGTLRPLSWSKSSRNRCPSWTCPNLSNGSLCSTWMTSAQSCISTIQAALTSRTMWYLLVPCWRCAERTKLQALRTRIPPGKWIIKCQTRFRSITELGITIMPPLQPIIVRRERIMKVTDAARIVQFSCRRRRNRVTAGSTSSRSKPTSECSDCSVTPTM